MEALAGYDSDETGSQNKAKAKVETDNTTNVGSSDLQAEWESFEKMLGGTAFDTGAANSKVSGKGALDTGKPIDMDISDNDSEKSAQEEKSVDKRHSSDSDSSDESDKDDEAVKEKAENNSGSVSEDSDASAKSGKDTDSESESSDSDSSSHASSKARSPIPQRISRSESKSPETHKDPDILPTKLPPEKLQDSKQRSSGSRKTEERRISESGRDRSKERRRRSRSRERRHSSPSRSSRRRGSRDRHRRRRSRSGDRKRRHRSPRRHRSRDKHRRSDRKHRSRSRDRHRHRTRRSSSRSRHRRGHGKSRSRSRDRTRPRPRSRSPLVVDKRRENKKLNFKEQLKQSLLSVQKQAHEGKLDLSKLDADGKELAQREKPSDLPLNTNNPLSAMASSSDKVTPQMALLQTMAAMHQKAQQITGIAVPKYYNPAAVNPLKYAEQIQKRKLLWSKKKEQPEEEAKPYNGLKFQTDSDGKTTEKFRKLMGIKQGESAGTSNEAAELDEAALETLKKQEELFRNLDKEYDFARTHTHTQRGMGLGFSTHNVPLTIEQLKAQQQQKQTGPPQK